MQHSLRRTARFLAAAFFPSTRFSSAWSSSPCSLCSSRICSNSLSSESGLFADLFARAWKTSQYTAPIHGGYPHLGENLSEQSEHSLLVKFISVILEALDEFLDRTFRLERKKRQAICNIAPLPRIFGQSESLAKFVHDVLCLFLLLRG